ncbi:hypothetical protein RBG61_05980 [Paludicola sp. MB14-C6]|uniref:hypothetical protein n=1 Tax=Paludihabitans sp. MB14-C6 TaxID=3070656 RepID=UPI0027DC01D3|nr:hypothetical protein [Paludicola sp. MB14-C6]WMJ24213.1 hypothetical protein RBG61_05980 [Paludicola sp. MB14-C6]
MALCPTCNQEYADELSTCPNCALQNSRQQEAKKEEADSMQKLTAISAIALVSFILFSVLLKNYIFALLIVIFGGLLALLYWQLSKILKAINHQTECLKSMQEILLSQNQNNSNGNR